MEIISARFTTPEHDQVEATFDTEVVQYIPYPCRGSGCQYLKPYEAQGGTIDPYVAPPEAPEYDVVAEIEALKVRVTQLEEDMPGRPK